jgi:hypothetical protein
MGFTNTEAKRRLSEMNTRATYWSPAERSGLFASADEAERNARDEIL